VSALPVQGGKIIGEPYQGSHRPGAGGLAASWESDNAVDIAVPVGTPVYAVQAGTIGPQFGSLGSSGVLEGLRLHLNGRAGSQYYAHLSSYAPGIAPGVSVQAGDLLGYSGSANGVAHLHFADSRDPLRWVAGLPGSITAALTGADTGSSNGNGSSGAALPAACSSVLLLLALVLALAVATYGLAGVPIAFGMLQAARQ
jgi:hypothetical protein